MESGSLKLAKRFLGKKVEVTMDRPLGSKHPKHGFTYEANYGFVAGVLAPDGEELDAYYLKVDDSLQKAEGICVAIIHRLMDDDDKLIVIPEGAAISDEEIAKVTHFQERWFESEIVRIV
jgi:inorganic pyrophosphatase